MILGTGKNILHNLPYESISVTIDAETTGTETVNGRKILPAGTMVSGFTTATELVEGVETEVETEQSVFDDATQARFAKKTLTGGTPDGITLNDVDVTEKNASVAMAFRGTVYADKIIDLTDEFQAGLPLIKFVK